MASRLLYIPKTYPFAFGIGFSCAKTSVSDLLVQLGIEQKRLQDVDWRRNAAFATFGFFYLGGVQYTLYVPIFGRMFPNTVAFAAKPISEKLKDPMGFAAVGAQVFLDQCVHHPLMYFPAFYITKEVVTSDEPSISHALERYQANMQDDLLALWKVWVPATFMNFAFSPMWLRIPVVASTSLLWTCILSSMRGGADVPIEVELANQAAAEAAARAAATPGDLDAQGAALLASRAAKEAALDAALIGAHVDGATLKLLWKSLTPFREVADHETRGHMVMTATGPDRIGLVANITRWVYEHGGSIDTSKMLRLGGEFTVMLCVSAPSGRLEPLRTALHEAAQKEFGDLYIHTKEIGGKGMTGDESPASTTTSLPSSQSDSVRQMIRRQATVGHWRADRATATAAAADSAPSAKQANAPVSVRIRCSGADKPGMLFKIADFLSAQRLNIDDLHTELRSTMLNGEAVSYFMVHGEVTGSKADVERLRKSASKFGRELDVFFQIQKD